MLGKLIKYEWKSTCRMGLLMLGSMVLVTLLGWMAFQTPMWQGFNTGKYSFGWLDIFSLLTLLMYVVLLAGTNLCVTIYIGVHFYQTMYTDQGYLTHTLPVTKQQILGSKLLVSGLWLMLITIAMYLSAAFLGFTMLYSFAPDFTAAELLKDVADAVGFFMSRMRVELGLAVAHWLWALLVALILGPFSQAAILFGAISMGQLFSKHRVLMSVLCYIGILVVNSILNSLLRSIQTVLDLGSYMNFGLDMGILLEVVMGVGLYIVSYYVINRKLNLE